MNIVVLNVGACCPLQTYGGFTWSMLDGHTCVILLFAEVHNSAFLYCEGVCCIYM